MKTQDTINKIATIFQNNVGNRITIELANGMLSEIIKHLPEDQQIEHPNPTDTSTKK